MTTSEWYQHHNNTALEKMKRRFSRLLWGHDHEHSPPLHGRVALYQAIILQVCHEALHHTSQVSLACLCHRSADDYHQHVTDRKTMTGTGSPTSSSLGCMYCHGMYEVPVRLVRVLLKRKHSLKHTSKRYRVYGSNGTWCERLTGVQAHLKHFAALFLKLHFTAPELQTKFHLVPLQQQIRSHQV